MTNLPNDLREMWADIYRAFDECYGIANKDERWERFHELITRVKEKHNYNAMSILINAVYDLLEETCDKSHKTGDRTLYWGKGEDYPYPTDEQLKMT